jgi:hypothetical protein
MPIASEERQVVLGEVPEGEAKSALKGEEKEWNAQSLPGAIPEFKDSNRYSFKAKWAVIGEDIQIQFFLPKHAKIDTPRGAEAWQEYWLKTFAAKLDTVARKYFDADSPRLLAKYTPELASWWFKAQGFAHMLDPEKYVESFLDQLNETLDAKEQGSN